MNQPRYTISEQITQLKRRGMLFKDESAAYSRLKNYGYCRLQGYYQDCLDASSQQFHPDIYFEAIIDRYEFDRSLRLMLFAGIKRIEIGVRSRLVNSLSDAYGEFWYLNHRLFDTATTLKNGVVQTTHLHTLVKLQEEFNRAQEPFIREHQQCFPVQPAEAWRLMEIASMGTLSKLYRSLEINLRERGLIAKDMGVYSPKVFAGWLESISLMRNITAHHMPLWNRTMKRWPSMHLKNPCGAWFTNPLTRVQLQKPFSTISCIVYLCNHLTGSDELKHQILSLIKSYPNVPIYKYGFFNHWELEPIWRA